MDDGTGPLREGKLAAFSAATTSSIMSDFARYEPVSRTASPAIGISKNLEDDQRRYRPRTFAYFQQLPFEVEKQSERDAALDEIIKQLYIAVRAEDLSPGALHWTRELEIWINLKFEMPRDIRAKLTKLYYSLALSPGVDPGTADRFLRMVLTLTRYFFETYLAM